jgi:hypothetical protein
MTEYSFAQFHKSLVDSKEETIAFETLPCSVGENIAWTLEFSGKIYVPTLISYKEKDKIKI